MKNSLKKIIPLSILVTMLGGCSFYTSKPGPKENVIGTYELSEYKMKESRDAEAETYDYKKASQTVAYFTIDEQGYGFYGFKDKDTPARVSQVFSKFGLDETSEEHPEYVKNIEMSNGHKVWAWNKKPGCLHEEVMGFHDNLFSKVLSYTTTQQEPEWYNSYHEIDYRFVSYTKISNETGLDIINKKMGTSVSFSRIYEMKDMNRYLVYRCSSKDGSGLGSHGYYDYAILDNDALANKVRLIYKLKDSAEVNSVEIIPEVPVPGYSISIDVLGRTFTGYASSENLALSFSTAYDSYGEEDVLTGESFTGWYSNELSFEEIVAQELADPNK